MLACLRGAEQGKRFAHDGLELLQWPVMQHGAVRADYRDPPHRRGARYQGFGHVFPGVFAGANLSTVAELDDVPAAARPCRAQSLVQILSRVASESDQGQLLSERLIAEHDLSTRRTADQALRKQSAAHEGRA